MDNYDNANLQHVGCRWRPVHRVWARLAGSGRGHEGRLSGAKGLTATNGAISTFQGRVQSNPTHLRSWGTLALVIQTTLTGLE